MRPAKGRCSSFLEKLNGDLELYMGYISYIYIWDFPELINMIRQKVEETGCWLQMVFYSPWDDDGNPDMELVYICLKNWEPTVPLYYSVFHHAP